MTNRNRFQGMYVPELAFYVLITISMSPSHPSHLYQRHLQYPLDNQLPFIPSL